MIYTKMIEANHNQDTAQKMFFAHGCYSKLDDIMEADECDKYLWKTLTSLQKNQIGKYVDTSKGIYEFLRDHKTQPYVKPYFDVDIETDTKYMPRQVKSKVSEIKSVLTPYFKDRPIHVSGAVRRKDNKWKTSFHVVVGECFIKRTVLKDLVDKIHKSHPEFDYRVYSLSSQKFRLIATFKDGEGYDSCLQIYENDKFRKSKFQDFPEHCIQNVDLSHDEIEFEDDSVHEMREKRTITNNMTGKPTNTEMREQLTITTNMTGKPTNTEMETLLYKLNSKFTEDYGHWLAVACALKTEGYSVELFHTFSKRCPKKYNPAEVDDKWRGLAPPNGHTNPKTLASLMDWLKESDMDHFIYLSRELSKRNADKHSAVSGYTGITSASHRKTDHYRAVITMLADTCNKEGYAFHGDTVYKKTKPMFYERVEFEDANPNTNDIHSFINKHIFRQITNESVDWVLSRPQKIADLIKTTKIVAFGFKQFKYDRNVVGFDNGWFHISNWTFTPYDQYIPDGVYAKVHFDIDFDLNWLTLQWTDIPTPHYNSLWESQNIEQDVLLVAYGLLGQLHYSVHDNNFQVALYIKGTPDSGKSTVIEPIKHMFPLDKTGSFDHKQKTFGMTNLAYKFVCIDSDTPEDMVESMGKTEFQKMISGEQVVLPIKNEQKSLQLTLDMHALMVSNYIQKCQEAGEISRRLATLLFKPVSGKDATLKHKIIKETPLIFIKTLLAYRYMKSKYEHLPFSEWGIEYFDNQKEEALYNNNPVYKFIDESPIYSVQQGHQTMWNVFETDYKNHHKGSKIKTTDQIFSKMGIDVSNSKICKHCSQLHKKGCCERYSRTDRTTVRVIQNLRCDTGNDTVQ
jgi:hypothetical protein